MMIFPAGNRQIAGRILMADFINLMPITNIPDLILCV
jgi:hypothetical protein